MRAQHTERPRAAGASKVALVALAVMCGALWSCAAGRTTQVVVILDADEALRASARSLEVSVSGPDGLVLQRRIDPSAVGTWPYRVPIIPAQGDAARGAAIDARLADGAGAALGTQAAAFDFIEGELRFVRLRFVAACQTAACTHDERCAQGACVERCVSTTRDEAEAPTSGPCPAFLDGVDGGVPDAGADATIGDAGVFDAALPPDAGPPPRVVCPEELPAAHFIDAFESVADVPARCGAPRCETSNAGRVDQLTQGSPLFTPGKAMCGTGALRLNAVAGIEIAPTAFVAYPSAPELGARVSLRAWVFLDSPSRDEFGLLGAAFGPAYRSASITDGTTVVVESSGLLALVERAPGEVERRSSLGVALPRSAWSCLELVASLDTGEMEAFVDGRSAGRLTSARRAGSTSADVGHLRLGLFALPDASVARTLWIDGVVIDGARHPCPLAAP